MSTETKPLKREDGVKIQRLSNLTAGGRLSVAKLKDLGFDPIEALVHQYRFLEEQLQYYNDWRDNKIVPLTSTGKTKWYNEQTHMNLIDKMTAVSDKLLRYKYGRVPETNIIEDKMRSPLVINLTREGDTHVIGEYNDSDDEDYE
jgi:hypothetical protein